MKEKKNRYIEQPTYPGGNKALLEHIKKQLNPPEDCPSGIVKIRIYFNHKGVVFHTEIIKSLDTDCDKEADRVCRTLKFITPKVRDMKVRFQRVLNIRFDPPKKQAAPRIQVSYKITKQKEEVSKSNSSYNYTLDL